MILKATSTLPSFSKEIKGLGTIKLCSFQLDKDCKKIHEWVTQPYAKYWEMQNFSLDEVQKAYRDFEARDGYEIYMGKLNGKSMFLMECYVVTHDPLSSYYDCKKGDVGMHILVAPADRPIPNFTTVILQFIMDFLFEIQKAKRVVVEPDIHNEKIHALNKKMGFTYHKVIELPHKKAALAFCTQANFNEASIHSPSFQYKK